MVLDQEPDEMRFIRMYSNNNSNLSLVPGYSEEEIVDKDFRRYSFTSGELYDERAQISVLLEKAGQGRRTLRQISPECYACSFCESLHDGRT